MKEKEKLSEFENNLRKECKKYNLRSQFYKEQFCISTGFENFWFDSSLDYVAIRCREIKFLNSKKKYQSVGKMKMKPSEIVKMVLGLRTIKNKKTYEELYFQELEKCCEEYGLRCELKINGMYIYTFAEEFYVSVENNNVELMHFSTKNNTTKDRYHQQQFIKNKTPKGIVKYVKKHSEDKYKIVPNRLSKSFAAIRG